MKRSYHGQMSESFVVGILLCLCGGFQDAYTYVCRDKVFANAQTGNIVLLGNHLAQMDWSGAVRYAVPILAFTAGIFVAQKVHFHFGKSEKIHWRQLVLLLEIVVLFAAGFFPTGMSLPANALISFSCAMQVDSFRKIRGNAMATTMCIGNLRSATDLWCAYTETKDKKTRQRSLQYYSFILVFAIGATLGGIVTDAVGVHAVARHARRVLDNGQTLACQTVEELRFADIRTADDRNDRFCHRFPLPQGQFKSFAEKLQSNLC